MFEDVAKKIDALSKLGHGQPLSSRRLAILQFIGIYLKEHNYPPTVREIATGVGLSSSSTANNHLNILAREGFITKGKNARRTVTVTEKGRIAIDD